MNAMNVIGRGGVRSLGTPYLCEGGRGGGGQRGDVGADGGAEAVGEFAAGPGRAGGVAWDLFSLARALP